MKRLALATLLLATPALLRAQGSTQDKLNQAISLYEAFNVEAARPILMQIISPSYLQQVSAEQRATAYKYLGASYAILASPDSATQFFIGALDFDPFTDLDPTKFALSELQAFAEARRQIFKVAVRQITEQALIRPQQEMANVDSAAYIFRVISTKRANLRVSIAHQTDTTARDVLYNGPNDGSRNVPWRGVLSNGEYAPPGVYTLTVQGTETSGGNPQQQQMNFRIEHIQEPMEVPMPELTIQNGQLLQERYPTIAPWQDLIKGIFVGAVAFALPLALDTDISTGLHAASAGVLAVGSGTISFLYRRRNPSISVAVKENERRRGVRSKYNTDVENRNRERKARTLLVISPVSSAQ